MNKSTIEKMREMVAVQGQPGNYDLDEYMRGMYNGMEFMLSIAEGREPVYKSLKIYRMNEGDTVLHYSFDEAKEYYDKQTGVFDECKDDETGEEYEIDVYKIWTHEEDGELVTVKEAIDRKLITIPSIFSTAI
jgi:hypothetical protein